MRLGRAYGWEWGSLMEMGGEDYLGRNIESGFEDENLGKERGRI